MNIPAQYLPVMPYLIVNDAKALIEFSKHVFGATEQMVVPAEKGIMHAEIRIHDAVIMLADATDDWKQRPSNMFLYVENVDDVYKKALDKGARSLTPPEQKDYGYTAGFEDAYGNQWFIVEAEKA